jgi:hypothetical protein
MIFLLEYDRKKGVIVSRRTFDEAAETEAQTARIALELELNRLGVRNEVVLLDAHDEAALRRTHGRYFEGLSEIKARVESSTSTFVVQERPDD